MDKNVYKFFSVAFLCLVLFNSCKKNNDVIDPGLTYGIIGIEPAMASTGDTIRVYGVGFVADISANSLKINGIAAKIIAASPTELIVIVPEAPRSGNISIQTGSKSFNYNQQFNVATIMTGNQKISATLAAEKLYLLKGEVHVVKGATLTIPAGTTIMADKGTLASLIIDEGATVMMNGTAEKPIVFTSNQPQGFRSPGDWKGIILATSQGTPDDNLKYLRIEYAGYHLPNEPGAALLINRDIAKDKVQYIQASYSGGDGFRSGSPTTATQYLKYLMAYGCAGNDFDFAGESRVMAQFLIGYKDPLFADQFGADGLLVQSTQLVTISNLTLVGYNSLARKITTSPPDYNYNQSYDEVLNRHAGRGVHLGGYNYHTKAPLNGRLQLFNSLIAAPWLAGISVDGPLAWSQYGNSTGESIIKYSTVTYTLATAFNSINHDNPPIRGYMFSKENLSGIVTGFAASDGSNQSINFNTYNDSLKLMLTTPFLAASDPNATYDDLGIANMVTYNRLTNPLWIIPDGSTLLKGAIYSDFQLNDSFIDKTQSFRGAVGKTDWTKNWSNYVPQQTAYN